MKVRGIRGATTAPENTKEAIKKATAELLTEVIKRNNIDTEDIVSIIFTKTPDLDKVFPASAARDIGLTNVPLLDMGEATVEGSLKMCIRILMHINTDKSLDEINHVYLKEAVRLRPDLVDKK